MINLQVYFLFLFFLLLLRENLHVHGNVNGMDINIIQ